MNLLIGFFADGLPFTGDTIHARSLGGSESAVYYMARELRRMGNEVWVICNCDQPGTYEGVTYAHKRDFPSIALRTVFDVFIVSRYYNFFQVPFQSRLNILWNHDILDNKFALARYLSRIQIFFNLSRFHVEDYAAKIPSLETKIWQTRNGIDLEAVKQATSESRKVPGKMIYASRPERGLKILLESIWPRLRSIFPELNLYICSYDVDRRSFAPRMKQLYENLDLLVKNTPGAISLGSLCKEEYYRHLAEAQLMLYPCDFPEISCIVAIEAQACKTPIITSNGFALRETVGVSDWLVDGSPATGEYQDAFIHKVTNILLNHSLYAETALQAYDWVIPRYTWPAIAAEWQELFGKKLLATENTEGTEDIRKGQNSLCAL